MQMTAEKRLKINHLVWVGILFGLTAVATAHGWYREHVDSFVSVANLQEHEFRRRLIDDTRVIVDEQGRIIDWQPGMRELTGWDHRDVIGRHMSFLMLEAYRKNHDKIYAEAMKRGTTVPPTHYIACELIRKDGEVMKVTLRVRVRIDDVGNRFGVADFDRDVIVIDKTAARDIMGNQG